MPKIIEPDPFKRELKILFGIPCYTGNLAYETSLSLLGVLRYHTLKYPHHILNFDVRVRNFVTYAAEKICEKSLEYDYLFYCGDDVVFHHDTLEKLIKHDKDIVAMSIFARSEPFAFYAFDDDLHHFHHSRLNTGLQKAKAIGTGVTLFKTSVFEGLEKPWWRWPNSDETDCDTDFCLRIKKEKNIDVWVDTDIVAGHLDFSHGVIDERTHKNWVKGVKDSGVLEDEKFKKHKDFHKLEALVHA